MNAVWLENSSGNQVSGASQLPSILSRLMSALGVSWGDTNSSARPQITRKYDFISREIIVTTLPKV